SAEFRDFISKCLEKDPELRPTSQDLLQHPFILTAQNSPQVTVALIERSREARRKKLDRTAQMLRAERESLEERRQQAIVNSPETKKESQMSSEMEN
ncbi:hypothetical protein HDU67_005655, partial [Dinochytrium kinnereticum]